MGAKKRSLKTWKFALYVAGNTPRSDASINRLKQICSLYLGDDYAIEVIDLFESPKMARQHQILAVPTVIRTYPLPERRVIGDLSRPELVVAFLDIPLQQANTARRPEHPVSLENNKEINESKQGYPKRT